MADKDPLFQQAYSFSQTVKERFRNHDGKLKEFQLLLEKGIYGKIDMDTLVSKVSTLLGEENEDLLRKLKSFIPIEKTSIGNTIKSCLDLFNLARVDFKGNKPHYDSFIEAIIGFGKDKDINLLKRKTSPLLREHPELDLAFSEFIDSRIEAKKSKNDCLWVNDYKIEQGKHPGPHFINHKWRVPNMLEKKLFDCEDDMFECDMFEHTVMSVVESSTSLIVNNNSKRKNKEEEIIVGDYFSKMKLAFVKERLGENYNYLSVELKMSREKAIIEAREISNKLLKEYAEFETSLDERKERWTKVMQKNSELLAEHKMECKWKSRR